MTRIKLVSVTLAVAAIVSICVAAAVARTQTAKSGSTTATFSYSGMLPSISDQRLKIVHSGRTLYDRPVFSKFCGHVCGPNAVASSADPVRVLDLGGTGSSEVVLSLYTGGAHCCVVDQVFASKPGVGTYIKTEHNFADAGATIKRLGSGRGYEFVSADESFAYVFTDFADSGVPVQIWAYGGGRFHDVTGSYPALIRADAAMWLRAFHGHLSNGVGLIAAWAADEERLGNASLVSSTLAAEVKARRLRSGQSGLPSGAKFVAKLQKFLRTRGYGR